MPRLEELRLQAIEGRIEAELRPGRHARLVPELSALTAEHPLRERLSAQLMRSLALAVYQDARRVLIGDLGIEPGPELQEVQRQVLDGTLPAGGTSTGRGERGHRTPAGARSSLPPDTVAFTSGPGTSG